MDQLTKKIIEFGRKVRDKLPDPYLTRWNLPIGSANKEEILASMDFSIYQSVNYEANTIYADARRYKGSDRTSLAARLTGHDLTNLGHLLSSLSQMVEMGRTQESWKTQLFESDLGDRFVGRLAMYRAVALGMAYIASKGDSAFATPLAMSQTPHIASLTKKPFTPTFDENIETLIHTPEYLAFIQIIKNAPVPPQVYSRIESQYHIISISDDGPGIRDEQGIPLPPSQLPSIFGTFSSKGGGLGLQVAKELVHLRGGFIAVETTTAGNPTMFYDTKLNQVMEIGSGNPGTTFEIFVPLVK